ncbi:MAG: hypothetical protein R6X18_02655 [Chloroflexota bacterium]|jgi:hypothetical protein
MKISLKISMIAALLVLLLAACGGASEEPSVAFCDALNEINETGPTIAALGDVADLAQIVQLGATMDNNWKDLSSAVERMDVTIQQTFGPYDTQYLEVPAITQETAIPVARSLLDTKNAIATDAYNALYPGNCP